MSLYYKPRNCLKELIILIHKTQEGGRWNIVYHKQNMAEFVLFPGRIIFQLVLNLPTPSYFLGDFIFFSKQEQPRAEKNENLSKEQRLMIEQKKIKE